MSDSGSIPVVAIDGPSGAGKGTVARRVAASLGFNFLDSGAVYRAAALHCLQSHVDLDNETRVTDAVATMELDFRAARTSDGAPDVASDICLLYTSPSPRDATLSRMPSSA